MERVERRVESFLRNDRGLSPITINHHFPVGHNFLSERFPAHTVDLETLTLDDATRFLRGYREKVSPGGGRVP